MNLRGRIGRLEERGRSRQAPRECTSCGFPLPLSVQPREVRFEVLPVRVLGEPDTHDYAEDVCRACGRRLVYHLTSPRPLEREPAGHAGL